MYGVVAFSSIMRQSKKIMHNSQLCIMHCELSIVNIYGIGQENFLIFSDPAFFSFVVDNVKDTKVLVYSKHL